MPKPSDFDNEQGVLARKHINDFVRRMAIALKDAKGTLLEVGPQERTVVREMLDNYEYESLDITAETRPTWVGDLTKTNSHIPESRYDCIFCMEVLEHTINPFQAVAEIRRLAKHGAPVIFSAPLNWRIHGPIPDCWRFTEHGFRALLRNFDIKEIDALESPDRPLFPVHYNVLAFNSKTLNRQDSDLTFRFID